MTMVRDVEGEFVGIGDGSLADPSDFLALLKPRVMSLVVFTALAGLLVAPGHIHPVLAVSALLAIAVGAGAAGALNMWYDADIDAADDPNPGPADPGRPGRAATRRSPSVWCSPSCRS